MNIGQLFGLIKSIPDSAVASSLANAERAEAAAETFETDETLSISGKAADAAAVGEVEDDVTDLKSALDAVTSKVSTGETVSGTQRGSRIIDSTGSCATSNTSAKLYLVDVRDADQITVTSARKSNWTTAGPIVAMYTNSIDDALNDFTAQTCVLVGTVHSDGETYTETYSVPESAVTAVVQCNTGYSGAPTISIASITVLSDIETIKTDIDSLDGRVTALEETMIDVKTASMTQRGNRIVDSTGSCATQNTNGRLYFVDLNGAEKISVTSARKSGWSTSGPVIAMYTTPVGAASLNDYSADTCVLVGTVHTSDGVAYTETYIVPETAKTAIIQSYDTYGEPSATLYILRGEEIEAEIAEINAEIGKADTASFTKTGSANATKWIPHTIKAGMSVYVKWTTSGTPLESANIYTRATSSGGNLDTIKTNAVPDVLYRFVATQDAEGLFVSASASGTAYVYDGGTIVGETKQMQDSINTLNGKSQNVPLVRFDYNPTMYNPAAIFADGGEMGSISGWANTGGTIFKVHQAFDALVGSGGAGYGYGERIYSQSGSTKLYKENAGDTALFNILAPSYVTQGVSQGETITMPIGTDTDGNIVNYTYTYASAVLPYDVRLYRFQDTNNALHTSSKDIPKKKLLIFGGTHGNEFCAPVNLFVFAKHLCSDYANPDLLKLRSSFDVYIVPYLNGFGCQYRWNNGGTMSTGSRSNGHMVDINRNCDTYGWKGLSGTASEITASFENKLSNLGVNTYQGPSAGSEFEGKLAKALIEYIKPDVVIDHHHNNGNNPFYTISSDADAGILIYQAANDVAYAEMHNYPQYYGTAYNLYLGSEVSPATKAASNGYLVTMAGEMGVKMNATSEMSESIAWLNGVYDSDTKASTKYGSDVFSVSEYSLLSVILHLCQYAMEH